MSLPLASGVIPPLAPGDRPVNWAVTGRFGGFSTGAFAELNLAAHVGDDLDVVERNRARVAGLAHAQAAAFVQAAHGADVVWVDRPGDAPEADAVFTTRVGLPVVALGADCALIGLAAPGVVGVVHCGWRGLVAGAVPAAIEALRDRTDGPIAAVLGPAICARCYPVDEECAAQVRRACAPAAPVGGRPRVDVCAGVLDLLDREGITVHDHSICTFESRDLFSHRREAPTGRHGLMLWR